MYRDGDVLGRFVVESFVASGGMGAVYRAHHADTGERVAIKVLHRTTQRWSVLPGGVEDERFAREIRLLSQQQHPNIVRYVAHGTTPAGDSYLVMEWLEGRPLEMRLREGKLEPREARLLAVRIAEALATVHAAGIVHRDLKPSNLHLVGGSIDKVKLIDFGIAHLEHVESIASDLIGTFQYMSPEQARGEPNLDSRSDVFALGVILFRALTGRHPFQADNAVAMLGKIQADDPPHVCWERPEIPIGLGDLVARMLAKSPDDRPRDGAALVRALETQAPESVRSVPLADRARRVVSVVAIEGAPLATIRSVAAPFAAEVKPLGRDVVLLVLGGRQNARDQAVQAARCALALRKASEAKLAACTGFAETARGSRTGEAIDGAAALLADARPGEIRIDDVTAGLLGADFDVKDGRLFGTATRAAREIHGRQSPFVGRDAEIATLFAEINAALDEKRSRAIVVTGEAGAGKTRLGAELVKRLAAARPDLGVAFSRGDPLSAGAAFGGIAQVLRAILGVWGKTPEVRRACIRARVAEHNDDARIAEMIGEMVGVPFPETTPLRTARRDPGVMQDAMRAAIGEFVSAECKAQPWLVVVEDAHWGDLPSMKLLESALASARPFVILALARPSIDEIFPDLWKDHAPLVVPLRALDDAACVSFVRKVLGAKANAPEIVRRSGGNAFFLEELVRAAGTSSALPETIVAMAAARLDAVEPALQRALRAASVFGESFTREGVEAVLGTSADVEALEKREHVVPLAHGFAFRHDLLRQAAYDSLTDRDRASAHALAGTFLESQGDARPLVLAEHFERGGKADRAASWLAKAARQAIDGNDFAQAIECASRGLRVANDHEAELHLALAEAHRWRGELRDGADHAMKAADRFPRGSARWFEAVSEIVWSSGQSGAYDAVARWSDVAASEASTDAAKTICLARAGTHLIHGDRVDHARRVAAGIEAPHDDPIARAWVSVLRAWLAYYDNDWERYLAGQRNVAEAFESAGDRRCACREYVNVGHALMELGAFEQAIAIMSEWRAHAERAGLPGVVAQATQNIGYALGQMGRHAESLDTLERARRLETANVRHLIGCTLYLSTIARYAGDRGRAEREARAALEKSGAIPTLRVLALASLAAATNDPRAAHDAIEVLEQIGALEEGEALARLAIAEALIANGEIDTGRAQLSVAKEKILACRVPAELRAGYLAKPEHARIFELTDLTIRS